MTTTANQRFLTDVSSIVRFPTLNGSAVVYQADVLRMDRAMDSAMIEVYPPQDSETWIRELRTGVPVHLTWTANRRTGVFAGYVHTVRSSNDDRLVLTCIGVGHPLQIFRGRAGADTSSRQIISDICSDNLLEYSTNPSGAQRWNITQGSDTDWNWLRSVTEREGLSLHFRGASLLCQPYDHILKRNFRATIDVVVPDVGFNRTNSLSQSPVRSFSNTASTVADGSFAKTPSAYGMVTSSGQIANVVSDGSRQTQVSLAPVTSPEEALTTLPYNETRWTNHADLVMDGEPSLHPLDLVRTARQGTRVVAAVWSVISVKHCIRSADYTVECKLGEESAARAELLQRRVDEVVPFYRLHRQTMGGTEWYITPVLRPMKASSPTRVDVWQWTAEQVVGR